MHVSPDWHQVLQAESEEAAQLAAAKSMAAQAQNAAALAQNEALLQAVQEAKQQLDAAGSTIESLTTQAAAQAQELAQVMAQVSRLLTEEYRKLPMGCFRDSASGSTLSYIQNFTCREAAIRWRE